MKHLKQSHELKLTDVIIGAIPTEVTVFENPLGYMEVQISNQLHHKYGQTVHGRA